MAFGKLSSDPEDDRAASGVRGRAAAVPRLEFARQATRGDILAVKQPRYHRARLPQMARKSRTPSLRSGATWC